MNALGMERCFLSQTRGGGGRGVYEKSGVLPSTKAVKDMFCGCYSEY